VPGDPVGDAQRAERAERGLDAALALVQPIGADSIPQRIERMRAGS
jgi:hypothetical protein